MNPVALVIALPILKSLFNGGSVAVSPTVTTTPPPPKDTGTVTLVTDVLTPQPITVTEPITGVVVPVRLPKDTPQKIRDRIRYGSGL